MMATVRPAGTKGWWQRARLLDAVVLGAALWWGWPGAAGDRWTAFRAPDVFQFLPLEGAAVGADLETGQGAIRVRAPAELVFRWADDAVRMDIWGSQGQIDLVLGDGAGKLLLTRDALTLQVPDVPNGSATTYPVRDDWRSGPISLLYEHGTWRALIDELAVTEALPGPPPKGRSLARVRRSSSFRRMTVTTLDGEVYTIESPESARDWNQALWAVAAAVLGLAATRHWWRALRGTGQAAPLFTAVLVGVALAAGVGFALHDANAERLRAPEERTAVDSVHLQGAAVVGPAKPFDLQPRKDGDFVLSASVVLRPDTVLDLLVRAARPGMDRGVLIALSSDPSFASGVSLNLGTSLHTEPAPKALATLAAGMAHDVEVRAEGSSVTARVDGTLLGNVRDLDLRVGRTAMHALSGGAVVQNLRIEPLGIPGNLSHLLLRWCLLSSLAIGAALALLWAFSGRGAAAVLACWPLAAAVWPMAPPNVLVIAWIAAAALLALTPARGRRLRTWTCGAGLLVAIAVPLQQHPEPYSPAALNAVQLSDVTGGPIAARYVWARHPLCRRFNGYLRDQTFRGRAVRPHKRPGVRRLFVVGSSSTFGYGVAASDTFGSVLDTMLGKTVEVVNAGVPGTTAERLRPFVENVLLQLDPDVIVIDLSFNDHILAAVVDERAHFHALTSEGIAPLDGWLTGIRQRLGQRDWQKFFSAAMRRREPTPEELEHYAFEPARRFEASLTDTVAACQRAGVAVVLLQEPTRPGRRDPVLFAYHDAMERVAGAHGLVLVSPQAALDASPVPTFRDQVHPTVAGHRILAAELARALRAAGLAERK